MALQQIFMANMKRHRKLAGFTQEKLAELCDTDSCYIRQIEIGRRFPSITYIERIAAALNIAPYRLFYDESDPSLVHGRLQAMQKDAFTDTLVKDVAEHIRAIADKYL
jgi:transcriptional regulator with XRE-family HTH domain